MKIIRIIILFLFMSSLANMYMVSAQVSLTETFKLKGQVVDSLTFEPVAFATLRIVSAVDMHAPTPALLLACDVDGYFSTFLPAAGTYHIYISSIGKKKRLKKVTISTELHSLDIGKIYMEDDVKTLGEVIVSARKPLLEMDIDKLVYHVADDPEAKVSNTLEMLRKVPMLMVDGDEQILLKGSGNFKIYINGRSSGLMNNNPSMILKSLPASSIKKIEVITDPGARYDAEGVDGIINIVMVRKILDGYTGMVRLETSTKPGYNAETFISLKTGKLGLTANYAYDYSRQPRANTESFRENFTNNAERYLLQTGTHWGNEQMNRGSLEGVFEIDSLNLISVDANLFRVHERKYTDMDVQMQSITHAPVYSYNRFSKNSPVSGSLEINANYQRETHRKGESLTLSYRFTNNPNDDENQTRITGPDNYVHSFYSDLNPAKTNEHTGQLDYVHPLSGRHELETGVKYIFRHTDSRIFHHLYDASTDSWQEQMNDRVNFRHTQHIYAAYLGTTFRWENWGFKSGVRLEKTNLAVRYGNNSGKDFSSDYLNVVPNVTLSYAMGHSHKLRLGYNMRIRRAGIDYLNPYVNRTDPLNISYGNPQLAAERSNSINFDYAMFTQTFNLNTGMSYTFVNNSIEQYTLHDPEDPNVTISTFGNIGKRQQLGLFLSLNWTPSPFFQVFMNNSVSYSKLRSPKNGLSNSGFSGMLFAGPEFTLPNVFRFNINIGYFLPEVLLQGKRSAFLFNRIAFFKDLFHEKIRLTLSCMSPFRHTSKMQHDLYNNGFMLRRSEHKVMREFRFAVAYNFGSLSDSFKKIKRGIVNDDTKENNHNGGL